MEFDNLRNEIALNQQSDDYLDHLSKFNKYNAPRNKLGKIMRKISQFP